MTIGRTTDDSQGRKASIRIGDATYPAVLDEEENRVSASWPAQEKEGDYQVVLVVKCPSGRQDKAVLGRYQVDGTPPVIKMNLIGRELDGRTTFNRFLTIMTTMPKPEPVSKWTVTVYDAAHEPIVFQEAEGQVPDRITWNGNTSSGVAAPDGDYVIRIIAWDRAGLSAAAEQEVSLRRAPPEVSLDVEKTDNQLTIDMNNTVTTPLLYWWLRVVQDGGRIVSSKDGDTLPASVTLELPENSGSSKFQLLLVAQDVLGNKVQKKFNELVALSVKTQVREIETESQWLEDF